ncbi:palmitoyltransferase ZDHHC4 isoform X1 [Echinops telfairi]|uniref:Palmitoyltransferase ZDHHC4 isoform X1 n=5 Tax=Echinops telfairi TaxID=9371 RepID=A0AC55CQG7_ECHTE|nr:palmitoyltransferase ZDHHC4 isoform X1 [Echinops telfairi]
MNEGAQYVLVLWAHLLSWSATIRSRGVSASRMDFLVLFFFYLLLMLTVVLLWCVCSRIHCLKGLVGEGTQVISRLIPECLQRCVQRWLHYLFHTRNHTFIVLHLVLQGLVYTEYTWEVFGYCQELEFSLPCLLLPYLLLATNLLFFVLSCVTDPGTVTSATEPAFLQAYRFDDVMFPKNARCPTCDLRKPARSKHCRVCNRCVHRFDHHCIWMNNCIGAWNVRYFLIYLSTLTASATTVAGLSAAFLVQVVIFSDLYLETYTDERGQPQVVDVIFLAQYLFVLFPRIIFLLGFVLVISVFLGGYLCFALYLAATNQTTNEWYKARQVPCQCCHPQVKPQAFQNIHNRGVWRNLHEVFLPAAHDEKKK